ncbi:MAG: hypothetical protein WBA22_01765 [Candidatus Methanofastidiosia archaeon]
MIESLSILSLCILGSCIIQGEDWPIFQHDLQHTGFPLSELPDPLKQSWEITGEHVGVTSFVIAGETLIVTGGGHVSALGAHSGNVLWESHLSILSIQQ